MLNGSLLTLTFLTMLSVCVFISILYIILYGFIGIMIYFVCAYNSKTIDEIVGNNVVKNIFSKIFKKLRKIW